MGISEKPQGRELTELTKLHEGNNCGDTATNSVSFVSAPPGLVSENRGRPHPVYGHDEFSLIRLSQPAIKPRSEAP
jgi:hypothetical protein